MQLEVSNGCGQAIQGLLEMLGERDVRQLRRGQTIGAAIEGGAEHEATKTRGQAIRVAIETVTQIQELE